VTLRPPPTGTAFETGAIRGEGSQVLPQNVAMHIPIRFRLPGGPLGAALLAGVLALVLSLAMSRYLQRDLFDDANIASRLAERQHRVVAAHQAATAALIEISRLLTRQQAASDRAVAQRIVEFHDHVEAMATQITLSDLSGTNPAYRESLQALSGFPDGVAPTDPSMLARTIEAADHLARLGRALQPQDDLNHLAQQALMKRLSERTVTLSCLMGLMFSLTAGAATFGVLLARRQAQTRREVEDARRAAVDAGEQAQAAIRDKSKFLGMLSHELLTPLQSIISSMDIIESKGRVEAGEPLFLRLREGTRSLRARLSDLVDFAKMSAGRLAVNPRKFRLDRLIEEVIADHEEAVVRKDLDIHWEPGPDLRQALVTDPRRVRQILDNLVSNAVKYTARGGVTVHAAIDAVEAGAGRLCLEVRDTGVGIAADALAHIFDPFFRVSSTAPLADGSGLGLAVVRSLVELLHGQLHVESTAGVGSRFVVWLPITTAAPLEIASPPPLGLPPVLVVDDAHDVRAAVAEVVRGLGYAPSEAGSGREALRALGERRFAAVLLDLDLPDVTGDEVARRVRQGEGPNRQTHLVMLSASHAVEAEVERWFDARADKPVAAAQLRLALDRAAALSCDAP